MPTSIRQVEKNSLSRQSWHTHASRPFVLHTDSSGWGLGAVLEQEQEDGQLHPVAYASRTLSKHERRYGITYLEALGVMWAGKYFLVYLLGHTSVVYTDHAPLKSTLKAKAYN